MSFEPAEVFWIEDSPTLELLADATRMQILELVLVPRSVAEIAEAMDVPRTRLYHHIKLLEAAGMIAVADTRPVGAVTEKVYRAAAHSYQPSEALLRQSTPRERAQAVMNALLGATQADFLRAVEENLVTLDPERRHRTASLGRRFLRMTLEQLDSFIEEFEALMDRYNDAGDAEGAQPVGILHVIHPSSRSLE